MSPSGKLWTVGIVCTLAGALLGGGAAMLVQRQQLAALQAQLAVAKTAQLSAQQEAADAKLAVQNAGSAAAGMSVQTTAPASAVATAPSSPTKTRPTRQYAFVSKIGKSGSAYTLVADYAEFLTGKAAATAATAHGDESPPPNDYYVVNDNPLLRTLPVDSGAKVKLYDKADGTNAADGYTVSVATWSSLMAPSSSADTLKHAGYWLTLSGGKVTAVQEQWVP